MTRTVVFDLDKTLISGNISYLFGRFLYKRKFFSFFSMCWVTVAYTLHTLFLISADRLHTISFRWLFFKKNADSVNTLAQEFINESLPALLQKAVVDRLQEAKLRKDRVMIFSSSPDFLVRFVAAYLLVAEFLATTYEIGEDGTFTKVGHVVDGVAKLKALSKFALNKVTAYSDSMHDFPLLEAAGCAIVVNPDKKLRKEAILHHWEIMDL